MTPPIATDESPAEAASLPAWSPSSWRDRPAGQQPEWESEAALSAVNDKLAAAPPLVIPGETRQLSASLAEVAQGRAFLLQAGDCAESFDSALSLIHI